MEHMPVVEYGLAMIPGDNHNRLLQIDRIQQVADQIIQSSFELDGTATTTTTTTLTNFDMYASPQTVHVDVDNEVAGGATEYTRTTTNTYETRSSTWVLIDTSSADVGSSAITSFGSSAIARATTMR